MLLGSTKIWQLVPELLRSTGNKVIFIRPAELWSIKKNVMKKTCSTYCIGITVISWWLFLYPDQQYSCGTSQHRYLLIFALIHNEHISVAWGKDNLVFHLFWALNALFLLFHFGIFFSYDVTTLLLCATLWNLLSLLKII